MAAYTVPFRLFACLLLVLCLAAVRCEDEKTLKLRKLEKIKEDDKDFQSSVQLSEPDAEGHIKLSGELKQHVTLDNDWKVNLTAYRADSADGEYKLFKAMPPMGVCQLLSSYYKNFFYEKLKDYSNAPHPDTCPLTPTDYYLKDYPLDSSMIKKMLQPGYYRVTGQLLKDDQNQLEYLAEVQVE
ncbi:CheA87a [Drosophila busckii]|uniref:CheA87a n=2 Tax=Drosophila busckii TaxID=30019 RepID=A0A0M4ELM7_DROBS|nr:CheA87a [Drosophila busckii]